VEVEGAMGEIQELGAEVVVVSFVTPTRLHQYLRRRPWPFLVLADPERAAYRAFGLESAGWLRLLKPRVLVKYLALIARGRWPRMAHEDVHQLGGDFVISRRGQVVFDYPSSDPADRPSVSRLLAALAEATG
jgi:peroxiredoxin